LLPFIMMFFTYFLIKDAVREGATCATGTC
jgi:hypothetical protein